MASQIEKSLTNNQNKELKRLRRNRRKTVLRLFLFGFLVLLVSYHLRKRVFVDDIDRVTADSLRSSLQASRAAWPSDLASDQLSLQQWLEKRGTSIELEIFKKVSSLIFISASKSLNTASDELGLFPSLYLSLHYGILRIAFIITACFRLWLLIIGFAIYRGYKAHKVYEGDDMLGQTGNSRLFYSGIRAGLENLDTNGAPNKQVRGLACPKQASEAITRASALYRVIEKYGVAGRTNVSLAAIIVEYGSLPAFVASNDDTKSLSDFIAPVKLSDYAALVLEKGLELHSHYASGANSQEFFKKLESGDGLKNSALELSEYVESLQKAMHYVLTPEMRRTLGSLPAEYIATLILSLEAGKASLFKYEGERWLRKSNYPQLCARSILHSVTAFADEYNFSQRTLIRHALIYASRSGDFGPVKLPVDMQDEARAMRQWSEILIANPQELLNTSNEVEMYGIVFEAHRRFKDSLFDKIMADDRQFLNGTYATMGNLFLVPFDAIYKLTRESLSNRSLRRLEELARLESRRQRSKTVQSDNLMDLSQKNIIPANSKVFEPLTDSEIKELSQTYNLQPQALKEWSSLRIILNNFGWLARRVGDYSVPESSLIFAVMKADNNTPGANSLGLIGSPSMVPLRASQLDERWGKTWHSRTVEVVSSTMAENREDYEKLLRGESLHDFEESALAV